MPVFDFNDEPKEEKKAPECTYTVIRSNETTASPEHPILVLDNSNRKWEHHSWGVFTNPIRKKMCIRDSVMPSGPKMNGIWGSDSTGGSLRLFRKRIMRRQESLWKNIICPVCS